MRRAMFLLLVTSAFAPAMAADGEARQSHGAWGALTGEISSRRQQAVQQGGMAGNRPPVEHHRERVFSRPWPGRTGRTERTEQGSPAVVDAGRGSESLRPVIEQGLEYSGSGHGWNRRGSSSSEQRVGRPVHRRLEQSSAVDGHGLEGEARTISRAAPIAIGDRVRVIRSRRPQLDVAGGAVTIEQSPGGTTGSTDWRRHQRGWTSAPPRTRLPPPSSAARIELARIEASAETSRPAGDRRWQEALRSGSPRRRDREQSLVIDRRHWNRGDDYAPWSHHWRGDHRFDWRGHRERHRWLFRLGLYRDPFGFSYQRFVTGWSIWPAYYGSSYWIQDPFSYRLPPAYGRYRWVRYHDDALLIDLDSGQVVDVIYNFFW